MKTIKQKKIERLMSEIRRVNRSMKICYDTLEDLIYQKDKGIWFKILTKKYKYNKYQRHDPDKDYKVRKYYTIAVCPICDNDFLMSIHNPTTCCSYDCAHYLRINKYKDKRQPPKDKRQPPKVNSLEGMMAEVEKKLGGKVAWSLLTKQILQDNGVEAFLIMMEDN